MSKLDIFVNVVLKVLSKNAPFKKHIRGNEATFMNKALKKASYEKIAT